MQNVLALQMLEVEANETLEICVSIFSHSSTASITQN